MRRRGIVLLTAAVVLGGAPAGAEAGATPAAPPPPPSYAFVDNRPKLAGPVARPRVDRALKVRWNGLGTPAAVSRLSGALATGLARDPEKAARQYLAGHAELFTLRAAAVDELATVAVTPVGAGSVVLLRQRFGELPAAHEGLVAVAVRDGDVLRVSSSLSPRVAAPAPARLSREAALTAALRDAGIGRDRLTDHRVRLMAMPMPGAAPRAAYQVVVLATDAGQPLGYTSYVDAIDGKVLVRENLVDFADDNPRWKVFPAPPTGSADTRETWCAVAAEGCARTALDPASGPAPGVTRRR
jgi:hypothetical protein